MNLTNSSPFSSSSSKNTSNIQLTNNQKNQQQSNIPSFPQHSSAAAVLVRHTLDSASALQQTLDRRKTFRCRGSLGPTVASAPSVEHEDYRTPKPSVVSPMGGKSFDFGEREGPAGVNFSDSNGLIKVSADFLRLNGSRQQFRSLLSRKKLGQMPPAYTQIDCSYESFDSNQTGTGRTTTNIQHPLIKVEDAGETTLPTTILPPKNELNISPSTIILIDSQNSSIDKNVVENGGGGNNNILLINNSGGYNQQPSSNHVNNRIAQSGACLKRNGSRYDGSAVKMVYKIRSQRLADRVHISDRCLILAMLGILLMIVDTELCGQNAFGIHKDHVASLLIRTLLLFSTIALLCEIIHYHYNEIQLDLVDCGADDWRVVLSWRRIWHFSTEFFLCSIIPLPGTGSLNWSFIEPPRSWAHGHERHMLHIKEVPVDVLLSLLMLSRLYLVGRWQVLHSKQFQDASTRTLAALNRIQVNFAFVIKTVLDQHPMLFLSIFLLIFWLITAWSFAQCERFGREEGSFLLYINSLWFIAITFNGNGYGDIVPKTLAGRTIAILVGISGAVISSILIAVISRKILLSQGQKNVNNFMNDSRLTLSHKHAAARVLQKTWLIYRCLKANDDTPDNLLRRHQRKFLNAIHHFRRIKNKIRAFGENSTTSMHQLNRLMSEMHSQTQKMAMAQEEMRQQLELLQRTMLAYYQRDPSINTNMELQQQPPN
uniref:Calmodulin-binding domain-containing protein n=1 Tax=Meloidogyne incognita TaxID=6306 RepID=A0A914M8X0_MELIC